MGRSLIAGGTVAALVVVAGLLAWLALPHAPRKAQPVDEQVAEVGPQKDQALPSPMPDEKAPTDSDKKPKVIDPEPRDPAPPADERVALQEMLKIIDKDRPAPKVESGKPPVAPAKFTVKRRHDLSEEDLRKQIANVHEIALDRTPDRADSRAMEAAAKKALKGHDATDVGPSVMKHRADLAGLPMRMGDACRLGETEADNLQGGSVALRAHLLQASQGALGPGKRVVPANGDKRPDAKQLFVLLSSDGQRHNKWAKPEAVPALMQLLMAEDEAVRAVLIDQLSSIDGKKATEALAQRALYDLHPDVRTAALKALRDRPREQYLPALLAGFRHPWPAIADHAAEALVALEVRDAVPSLLSLLDQPDPAEPFKKPGSDTLHVHEMVRVNHFKNCLMCHPVSFSTDDKVRGPVPSPDQPMTAQTAYGNRAQTMVRADVTYLRQDFSAQMAVKNHGPWPLMQRFDFLVRERPLLPTEVRSPGEARPTSEHQKSLFFALRELTGRDPGPTVEDWRQLFLHADKVSKLPGTFENVGGLAVDAQGQVFVSDVARNVLYRTEADGNPLVFLSDTSGCAGLAFDVRGRLMACQTGSGRIIDVDVGTKDVRVLADRFKGKRFNAPTHLAVDRQGGVYFVDGASVTMSQERPAVYYVSAQGTVTRLPIDQSHARGLALAADEKALYVTAGGTLNVMAYPLESRGVPGKGRVLFKLDPGKDEQVEGGADVAVDGKGNLYVAHPALNAVQVANAEGAKLGLLRFPEAPLHCALGGAGQKTLFAAGRTGLYAVKLDAPGLGVVGNDR
jgi:sugar lactone lactonase YvrE